MNESRGRWARTIFQELGRNRTDAEPCGHGPARSRVAVSDLGVNVRERLPAEPEVDRHRHDGPHVDEEVGGELLAERAVGQVVQLAVITRRGGSRVW